jgi:hypothetical protein
LPSYRLIHSQVLADIFAKLFTCTVDTTEQLRKLQVRDSPWHIKKYIDTSFKRMYIFKFSTLFNDAISTVELVKLLAHLLNYGAD